MSRKVEALGERKKLLDYGEREIVTHEFKLIEIITRLNKRENKVAAVEEWLTEQIVGYVDKQSAQQDMQQNLKKLKKENPERLRNKTCSVNIHSKMYNRIHSQLTLKSRKMDGMASPFRTNATRYRAIEP